MYAAFFFQTNPVSYIKNGPGYSKPFNGLRGGLLSIVMLRCVLIEACIALEQ